MKTLLTLLTLFTSLTIGAQNADKLYEDGKALYDAKNYTAAVPKLKAAAEKGHKKAQYRLGRCYAKGHGVDENDAKAVEWYTKSARQNFAKAQYRLGKCYLKGNGVAANQATATAWLKKSVRNPKGGSKVLAKLREEAKEGDQDSKTILKLIGK